MFCGDAAGVLSPSLGFACFAGQLKLSKNVPDVFVVPPPD